MEQYLADKNILFIAPEFYDYHVAIKIQLEAYGAKVTFHPEVKQTFFYVTLRNIGANFLSLFQRLYYRLLLFKIKNKNFDIFFLIKGVGITTSFLEQLKRKNPGIYFLTYQWDSIRNFDCRFLLNHFDESFTFDPADGKNFNIKYYPTFIRNEILKMGPIQKNSKDQIDFLFIGTFQQDRYNILKDLIIFAKSNKLVVYHHLYISKYSFIKQNLFGNRIERRYIKFHKIQYSEAMSLYSKSNCIIDIGNKCQTGLTMRVYEALGFGKKLITTCEAARDNFLYDENSVCILDIHNFKIPLQFLKQKSNVKDISALSLDKWVLKIFTNYINLNLQ